MIILVCLEVIRVRGDEIASHEHNRHVADRHGDPGKDQTGQKATKEPTGLKVQEEEAGAISQLDDRVSALKNENADLAAVVKKMKAGVALLKQEVIEHVNSGCDIRVAEGANF